MDSVGVPLGLHRFIPWRGVRQLIWRLLAREDREMIRMAQNSKRPPPASTSFTTRCARKGYISLLAWARAHGCPWDEWACQGAAITGQFETLKWLRAQLPPAPWDEGTFEAAVAHGNVEIVQWLADQSCPWTSDAYLVAARHGHVNMLEWFPDHVRLGPDSLFFCVAEAAKAGHVAVLEWAKAADPDFSQGRSTFACDYAAGYGHLQALQWLRINGFEWDNMTCTEAARHGHVHVLEWAIANGCPYARMIDRRERLPLKTQDWLFKVGL